MGAFAEAFAAFAQPLIDQTDGSPEQLQKALSLSQFCYNTALFSEGQREEMFAELRSSLEMEVDEFDGFRRSLLEPMIARHEQMFPLLHQRRRPTAAAGGPAWWVEPDSIESGSHPAAPVKKSTIDRYAPCPCNSGKKYKFCCGVKAPAAFSRGK